MAVPKGNSNTVVHGGEGALKRITSGEPFINLALEVYNEVLADLGVNLEDLSGIDKMLVERAARFEATARMFDNAAESAATVGDVEKWERFQQRSGWIGSKGFVALRDLRGMLRLATGLVTDYEVMLDEAG